MLAYGIGRLGCHLAGDGRLRSAHRPAVGHPLRSRPRPALSDLRRAARAAGAVSRRGRTRYDAVSCPRRCTSSWVACWGGWCSARWHGDGCRMGSASWCTGFTVAEGAAMARWPSSCMIPLR
jgi:hypothetical protein